MTHKTQMPYTNAFMQEMYRYRTLAPTGVPHKANANTEIDGYIIPKGTQVELNILSILLRTLFRIVELVESISGKNKEGIQTIHECNFNN